MGVSKLKIFLSSPGDVGEERLLARSVIERLRHRYASFFDIEAILWEWEPILATDDPQSQIIRPSQTDIVVCILWSRLGTPLGEKIVRQDGTRYASGTEFEFEDAVGAFRQQGLPDLLVYRKTALPTVPLTDSKQLADRLAQKEALDGFLKRWFFSSDGSFQAFFHEVPDSADFEERFEAHLQRLIEKRLQGVTAPRDVSSRPVWTQGSPFRGLSPFDAEHRAVFFGRTRAISEIKELLQRRAVEGKAFVLVLGASGSGKSSLLRAGLLPTITDPGVIEGVANWRSTVFRPADGGASGPVAALSLALLKALPELADTYRNPDQLTSLLREAPQHLLPVLQTTLIRAAQNDKHPVSEGRPGARLALVIDQLEEIFTDSSVTPEERSVIARAIVALATSGCVWVLATMRSDFYDRFTAQPELMELKGGNGQYDLAPPKAAEISQMITRPAMAAALTFEHAPQTGESLDDRLRDAAAAQPYSLPLLEFMLDQLFQRHRDRVLTFAAYEELEGLEGALAKKAEEVFESLNQGKDKQQQAQIQKSFEQVLRAIITVSSEDQRRSAARRVPLAPLETDDLRRELIQEFVKARLFVIDADDSGQARVGVAHEALIDRWPRLREWLERDREFLRTRARVGMTASQWSEENRNPDFLLPRGKPLTEARQLLAHSATDLDPLTLEFVQASMARVARSRRRLASVAGGMVVLVALFFLGRYLFYQRPTIEYYRNGTFRYDVAHGVSPISESEAKTSEWSLRLTRCGWYGHVARAEIVDGSLRYHLFRNFVPSISPKKSSEPDTDETRVVRIDYEPTAPGNPPIQTYYNRFGRLIRKFVFTAPTTGYYQTFDAPQAERSGASGSADRGSEKVSAAGYVEQAAGLPTHVAFVFNQDGFCKKQLFRNASGEPTPDADGKYGFEDEIGDWGLPLRHSNIDEHGKPTVPVDNIITITHEYSPRGELKKQRYYRDDQLVENTLGIAGSDYSYFQDNEGRWYLETNIGTDGKPATDALGIAGNKYRLGDRGEVRQMVALGADQKPFQVDPDSEGIVPVVEFDYDAQGNRYLVAFYDANGKRLKDPDGIAGYRSEFDDAGHETRKAFFDLDGKTPVRNHAGYQGQSATYKNHKLATKTLWGYDPKQSGFAKREETYDSEGRVIETRLLDEQDRPARHPDGYQSWTAHYERDALQSMDYFGYDGSTGFTRTHSVFDKDHNLVEFLLLDDAGKSTRHTTGHRKWKAVYQDHKLVKKTFLGYDPKQQGYAKLEETYDADGQLVGAKFFDDHDQPARHVEGYQRWTAEFAKPGVLKIKDFFGYDEKLGYYQRHNEYNDDGLLVEIALLDKDGKPARPVSLAQKTIFVYEGPKLVKSTSTGSDAKKYGFSTMESVFNDAGEIVEVKFLDDEGKPARHRDGYQRWTKTYEQGVLKARDYYGYDGQKGFFTWHETYNEAGDVAEVRFLDEQGQPARHVEGHLWSSNVYQDHVHKERTRHGYDRRDGIVKVKSIFAEDGKKIAKMIAYDKDGNERELPDLKLPSDQEPAKASIEKSTEQAAP